MSDLILYTTEDGKTRLDLRIDGGAVWLTQLEIAELFATSKQNVSLHIRNILTDKELPEESVVKDSLTTAADGKSYRTKLYRLEMILAVGYRVKSARGTQFRQWATVNLSEYLVKGFVMNDERLKNPSGWDYFDELLARIREIRASEKRFYQKVRDLFALSSDYHVREQETNLFFAEVQNTLLYAATRQTAAELVVKRADPASPNMSLTAWSGSRVRKQDVIIAKNYLTADEIDTINRLVVIFLEQADLRVKQRKDLTSARLARRRIGQPRRHEAHRQHALRCFRPKPTPRGSARRRRRRPPGNRTIGKPTEKEKALTQPQSSILHPRRAPSFVAQLHRSAGANGATPYQLGAPAPGTSAQTTSGLKARPIIPSTSG